MMGQKRHKVQRQSQATCGKMNSVKEYSCILSAVRGIGLPLLLYICG